MPPSSNRTTSSFLPQRRADELTLLLHAWVWHAKYSRRKWLLSSGQAPAPTAGLFTSRMRLWRPPPHSREQVDQALQGASPQSWSHDCTLQGSVSTVSPHGSPPCRALAATRLARCRAPPPHAAVQALQPPQSSSRQLSGQGSSLQRCTPTSGGQCAPLLGWTMTLREILRVPPPQEAEHSSGIHLETWQSRMRASCPFILSNSPRIFRSPQSCRSMPRAFSPHLRPRAARWPFSARSWLTFMCTRSSASLFFAIASAS
mmetsp:Transcript_51486/g.149570  ORF Transcript_51486/g.149570 Transcript_51486/m.149570 type:complete len:259 (-) Transcript_51486:546-1322(-)